MKFIINSFKRPCPHYAKFCFFYNKKSVNRKPFLVRTILFFKYQNFLRCVKTSKMPLRKFLRPTIFFVRRQNLLFLHSYPSSGHLISRTWLDVFRYMKTFAYFWCEQGYRNEKIGNDKKNYAIFLQTPNSIFCCVAGCKENRCYSLKMASLGSMYYPKVILPSLKKNVMSRIDYSSNAIWFPQKTSIAHQAS